MRFYVVWKGKKTGIFTSWDECKEQTHGVAGARYKSFNTRDEAEEAFAEVKEVIYNHPIRAIYADGGCIGGSRSFVGGTWAWVAITEPKTEPRIVNNIELGGLDSTAEVIKMKSGFLAGEITNNLMEFVAAVEALESLPEGWSGRFLSDSQTTIGRLFYGWKQEVGLNADIKARAKKAVARLGTVTPQHIDGHPTNPQLEAGVGKRGNPVSKWNKLCDQLCNQEKEGRE